ncbi:MAG: hypothetical protein ABSH26_15460 [Opitutaceae bacterium]|jgi:hypothetical protein
MKSPSLFGTRGYAAATGRLAVALVLAGVYSLASAQLSPGTITVSANVYGTGSIPTPTTGTSTTGATITVSPVLYDPVAMDISGTATASGTGGSDPNLTLSTTGMYASGSAYTPYNYNVSGTIQYSFEATSAVSGQPAAVLIYGNISASGSLYYPASYDITSSASTIANEDLLFTSLEPSESGSTLNYHLFSPASEDFNIPLTVLTNTPYTITLYSSYFSDLAPDAVTVSLDPFIILAPQYSADGLIFSPGFGPSGPAVTDGSLPLWITVAAMGAVLLWSRRGRRVLS